MNILYLHTHDAGRYCQPYGYHIPTPHLQRFAEEGVLFRQAFCAAPTCSPSRAALLTGQYPHQCGMFGLANGKDSFRLEDYSRHLCQFLGRNGYRTALAGMQHETGHEPHLEAGLGYEEILTTDDNGTGDQLAAHYAAEQFLVEEHDRPFFLSVGFGEPHRDNSRGGGRFSYLPGVENMPVDDRYCRAPEPIPDTPRTRRDMANFNVAMGILDRKIGYVLDALDRSGQAANTLVLVTTDHGIAWPHGKGNLTDMGCGVTMMLRGPEGSVFRGGKVIDALTSHLDFFPTVCDTAGLEPPDWLEGKSLVPLASGQQEHVRDSLFTQQTYHAGSFDPQRAVRTDRYKFILRKNTPHLRIVDPGPTNDWMAELGFRHYPPQAETELLYDLWLDPREMVNRAADPACSEIRADLCARLEDWMDRTGDVFLSNAFPPPRG